MLLPLNPFFFCLKHFRRILLLLKSAKDVEVSFRCNAFWVMKTKQPSRRVKRFVTQLKPKYVQKQNNEFATP